MATINDLSDAMLCEIFSYIDVVNRQRLEIVCKRWRTLIRVLWSKIKELSFDLSYNDDIFPPKVRKSLPDKLEISSGKASDIGAMLKICENNLTDLIIENEGPDGDATDEFNPLRNCKNLKRFYVYTYDNNLINDCLNNMPMESLEKLEVYNIEYEFTEEIDAIIEKLLRKAEQLTSLGLSGVTLMVLRAISMKSELKSLKIGNLNYSSDTDELCLDFTDLINLEDLTICEERMVDDGLLDHIAGNCEKLRRVKLWTENSLSYGLEALEQLPDLRIVDLCVPKEVEILTYFSNLEEFYCDLANRDSIDEKTFTEFLKRSPNLKKYYFNYPPYDELFKEIAKKLGKEISWGRP